MSVVRRISGVMIGLAVLVGLLGAAGCGGDSVPDPELGASQPKAMALEERDALPESFPIEIPVLSAKVTTAELQGEDPDAGPWHYILESEAARDDVVAWYRDAYAGRSWQIVTDTPDGTGYDLAFSKGAGAWSSIRVTETDTGCTVECWAGIGVAIPLEAQPPSSLGSDV